MTETAMVVKGARSMTPSKHAESEKIRVRVLRLRDEMTEGYFELGRLLYRVNEEQLYRQWNGPDGEPYQNFCDYVEHEVNFAFRKAKYLMSIWWWFAGELKDPDVFEKVREVGWNKAAILVGVVDSNNVDVWVEKAKTLGVKQLGEACKMALEAANKSRRSIRSEAKKLKPQKTTEAAMAEDSLDDGASLPLPQPDTGESGQEGTGVSPLSEEDEEEFRTRWTIYMDGPQRKNVEEAIDRANEMVEVEDVGKGVLLDLVATTFLAVYGGTVGSSKKEHQVNFRNELLRSVERLLAVNLVVFDRGTMKPIFGEQTIDRILEEGG